MEPEKQELVQKLDRLMAMSCIVNNLSEAASMAYTYGLLEIEAELADILMRTVIDTRNLLSEITG